ncbi:MAG: hypothetical protein A2297_00730 [Elusimicrobia bacterium RIFOXYB2_FULL_48_7]|nr:MAG: hypothetical protein A2297_00730 [Elusimicrobia bacterium RIFOXYB2_FULL_48_7]
MGTKLKYLDPATLLKLGKLPLRAKYVVEGLISGMHQSPSKGYSLEFAQHREYSPGDEIRHIDWKVFGRTDRFFVKQYEEETNLRAHILLDTSNSMAFKSGENIDKFTYGINLSACLAYLLLRQEDSVGLTVFDEKIGKFITPRAQFDQFSNIVNTLENIAPGSKTSISQVLNELSGHLKRRGLILIISDLYDLPGEVIRSLKQLRFKHHDVVVFQVLDPQEKKFDFTGPVIFESLEESDSIQTEADDIHDQYTGFFNKFIDEYKTGFRSSGIDYYPVTTDTPIELALWSFLAGRKK